MKETNEVFESIIAEKIASPVTIATAANLYQMVANGQTYMRDVPEAEVRVNRDRSIMLHWKHATYDIHISVESDCKETVGEGGVFD